MQPLLFMIDTAFSNEFFRIFGSTTETFDQECRVVTQPDSMLGTSSQTTWEDCIDQVLYEIAQNPTDLAIILGHKGIFDASLPTLDRYKAEARVTAAEKDLLDRLDAPKPVVYVRGFHHLPDSAIYRLLADPSTIAAPGTYTKLRLIVEEGGGPLGRLSVLKHNLMTPFGSVRLHLQLEAQDGAQTISRALVDRIIGAVQRGRRDLAAINTEPEENQTFHDAVLAARSLLERDIREITGDSAAFQRWIDQLNDALDHVRQGAR